MSTITIAQKNGVICMACESLTTFGTTKMYGEFQIEQTKILKWGNSLIGLVGAVAIKMVIKDIIDKQKKEPDFSSPEKIYKYFNKLHSKLKSKYHVNPNEDEDDPVESSQFHIAIANKHGIFGIHSLREAYQYTKYWAYGSGTRFALGAMHAVYELKGFDAEKIAVAGVQAGITFDDASAGKIHVEKIKVRKK